MSSARVRPGTGRRRDGRGRGGLLTVRRRRRRTRPRTWPSAWPRRSRWSGAVRCWPPGPAAGSRRRSGPRPAGPALAADADALLPVLDLAAPRDPFADPFEDGPRPTGGRRLVMLDDGNRDDPIRAAQTRLLAAADRNDIRVCRIAHRYRLRRRALRRPAADRHVRRGLSRRRTGPLPGPLSAPPPDSLLGPPPGQVGTSSARTHRFKAVRLARRGSESDVPFAHRRVVRAMRCCPFECGVGGQGLGPFESARVVLRLRHAGRRGADSRVHQPGVRAGRDRPNGPSGPGGSDSAGRVRRTDLRRRRSPT